MLRVELKIDDGDLLVGGGLDLLVDLSVVELLEELDLVVVAVGKAEDHVDSLVVPDGEHGQLVHDLGHQLLNLVQL
eukprot:CAMPEP_0168624566 /NCGR_PEP_ID=MMETSP0449_2-20121227/9491_1 /TAXON_ID=1082188 /ORGANISM="Strombidium rassoulzadegani, Strain ras09" /LENGTH=75 /DNA_ID=CAMNT_0008666151 /DNA_START=297 /DNA_END=524 /DNA_ORIENTATION=-